MYVQCTYFIIFFIYYLILAQIENAVVHSYLATTAANQLSTSTLVSTTQSIPSNSIQQNQTLSSQQQQQTQQTSQTLQQTQQTLQQNLQLQQQQQQMQQQLQQLQQQSISNINGIFYLCFLETCLFYLFYFVLNYS